jgi:hypothetical protein
MAASAVEFTGLNVVGAKTKRNILAANFANLRKFKDNLILGGCLLRCQNKKDFDPFFSLSLHQSGAFQPAKTQYQIFSLICVNLRNLRPNPVF